MAATNVEKSREAIRTRLEEQLSHNFEPAPKSIADLKFLTLWETRSISTFEVLEEFPHIEHIHFFGQSTIADLTGIERLPRLQSIRFEPKVKIRSGFDSVFKVATLESLTLSSQFHRLVNLQPSVRKLNLSDASISTLPSIPKSARVEELHVGHRKHVLSDLKSLCHYPKLKNLCVDSSKTMNSLAGVEYCSDLAVLSANLTAIDNLGPLSNALKLTELRIRKTNVKSLSPLFQNDSLETLYAEKSKLTEIDGIAEGLPNLRLLWLFDTKIKDLSPIAGLKQLSLIHI